MDVERVIAIIALLLFAVVVLLTFVGTIIDKYIPEDTDQLEEYHGSNITPRT